ncbi:DUF1499 domain-containing protein [Anaerolineales bacterium HSG6]|nr:DUF1499 domain-containing protein [Anaerolineales bacterium HSG6]MDM8531545.1 DUF1499 domain-containing protein [Anaerolineales bacterium HSG25]
MSRLSNTNKAALTLIAILTLCLFGILISRLIVTMFSPRPSQVGTDHGAITPCPDSPNCVVSITEMTRRPDQQLLPFVYQDDMETAQANLLAVLEAMPQITVISASPTYIHAESQSWLFGFVDDTEFYFDSDEKFIHVRAASRLGYYDGEANRKRVEAIRHAFSTSQP